MERTGTSVLESRYDAIIASPTDTASGTKRFRAAPCMKRVGRNTARIDSIASSRGVIVSIVALRAACGRDSRGRARMRA